MWPRQAVYWMQPNDILSDGLPNLRTYQYSSSNIWTKKNDFLYGKYEIKCRISNGKGLWPAFWTYSGDGEAGGPIWCEHDFFEIYHNGNDGFKFTNNLHFDLNNDGSTAGEQCKYATGFGSYDFSQWHTFTIYFEEDKIEYFIDNNFVHRKTRYITTSGQSLFCGDGSIGAESAWDINGWPRQPMQLILNMALETGNNAPDVSTIFPSEFEIDYVRYWEKVPAPIPCNNNVVIVNPFTGLHKGENAFLSANAIVISSAEVLAQNVIQISPNFHAPAGSIFHTKIDPNVCDNNAKLADSIPSHTIKDSTEVINSSLQSAKQTEINNINNNQFIQIYPNPNSGQFTLKMNNTAAFLVEIYNVMGKKIFTKKIYKII